MPDAARRALLRLAALALLPVLAACGGPGEWASDSEVQRARYSGDGPAEITLYTVAVNRTGAGDHASLVINGDERVLYDPAGSWHHRLAPKRNDVHFGMSPAMEQVYVDYHVRETHHVVAQTIQVTREQANAAIAAALEKSPAGPGFCAVNAAAVLREIPGLEDLPRTFFPRTLKDAFGAVPGVVTRRIEHQGAPQDAVAAAG